MIVDFGTPPHYLVLQKITPKSAYIRDKIARIGQNRPNICIFFPIKNAIRDGGTCTAYTVDTVYTVYIVQSASHCLDSSMYAYIYIYLGKDIFPFLWRSTVRALLVWADGLRSKK